MCLHNYKIAVFYFISHTEIKGFMTLLMSLPRSSITAFNFCLSLKCCPQIRRRLSLIFFGFSLELLRFLTCFFSSTNVSCNSTFNSSRSCSRLRQVELAMWLSLLPLLSTFHEPCLLCLFGTVFLCFQLIQLGFTIGEHHLQRLHFLLNFKNIFLFFIGQSFTEFFQIFIRQFLLYYFRFGHNLLWFLQCLRAFI